jgi:hypothetical protein
VKAVGAATSATRTPAQTDTARFWNGSVPVQHQAAFRDLATRHRLDIDHSARMLAILNMTAADAAIACWRGQVRRPLLASEHGHPARRQRRQPRHHR